MSVKISVIIPVFNCDEYLDTCILSVLMQNFQNYEIICIDDNSNDNSLEILQKYAKKDKRINIFTNTENKGSGYSRNKALSIAKGKYVFFLDGDDWIDKETLGILYNQCEKDNLDIIMFKNIVYYSKENDFGYERYYDMNFMNKYDGKIFNHWDLNPNEVFKLPVGPCNKLYKKSFLEKNNIRFPNENIIQEDNPFFFKVITLAENISIINKYLYNRRRWSGSIMGSLDDEMLFSRIYVADLLIQYFLEDNHLYDHYKKNLLNYISNHLTNAPYTLIKEEFKEEMYESIQNLYIKFYDEYGIKEDVLKYVKNSLLIKFGLINK